MSNWYEFAVAAVLVLLVVGLAILFGYKLAEGRTPGALTLGDRVDIKDHGIIVGRMVLTEFVVRLNEPTTATLTDHSAFLKDHTIPPGPGSTQPTEWSWDR